MKVLHKVMKAALVVAFTFSLQAQAQESGFSVSTVGGTASSGSVSGYDASEIDDAISKGYGPQDSALYKEAQDGNGVDTAYTPGCLNDESARCNTLTMSDFKPIYDQTVACGDTYSSYAVCTGAVAEGYGYTAADATLYNEALLGTYNSQCQTEHSENCGDLTKAQYTALKSLINNCGVYPNFATCKAAVAQSYGYTTADVNLWNEAVAGTNNANCSLDHPTKNCDDITKAQYQAVKTAMGQCSSYSSYSVCKTALTLAYGYGDAALRAEALTSTNDVICQALHSKVCSLVTKPQYQTAKAQASACSNYTLFGDCQTAQVQGYGLGAADATLYQTAQTDTANNAACISVGGLAVGTSNACSTLTKAQYNAVSALAAANSAMEDAIGDASNANNLTVAQILASDAYTGFAGHNTGCSTVPSQAVVTSNLSRFQHFLAKATFTASAANLAKQLCYATGNHSALTWHNDAPTDYIIAANNSITTQPDWKKCGFWRNRTALSKTSTNAMKSASRTIIYDVKSQADSLNMTAPSISSDKGHAVLNYTLNGQGTVSNAAMTLSVLGRSSDGFIVASAPDRDVTVSAEEKIQTNDAVYNVYQRTASSRTYTLRDAINGPGPACPAGYSLVSTTNSSTLNTLRDVAIKHGTGAGTMPSGHRMEQCANQFLECNAGFSACSNPNGANWRMRLMIYGEKNGQTCAATRKKAPGGGFYTDKTDWPSGFSMYPPNGQCKDVGTWSGTPRLANGCVGWCWVRALCKKDGATQAVWQ